MESGMGTASSLKAVREGSVPGASLGLVGGQLLRVLSHPLTRMPVCVQMPLFYKAPPILG